MTEKMNRISITGHVILLIYKNDLKFSMLYRSLNN